MASVGLDDGIDQREAEVLSAIYFFSFISGCGTPGEVMDKGDHWEVEMIVGIAAQKIKDNLKIDKQTGRMTLKGWSTIENPMVELADAPLTVHLLSSFPKGYTAPEEVNFQFQKSRWPGTYHLAIHNNDPVRAVEFYGCYGASPDETAYYLMMENGSKFYFDSDFFCQIGAKGRYGVNPGQHGSIPFKIRKEMFKSARQIVFKGVTYTPRQEDSVWYQDDVQEMIVTYDVLQKQTAYEYGQKIESKSVEDIFSQESSSDFKRSDGFRLIGSQDKKNLF